MTLILLALLAQLQKPNAQPRAEAPRDVQVVQVKVGEQKPSPTPTALGVNCDDRSIVEVLDLGDHLEFKGLAPGKTLCGLGRGKLPPQVVEITVTR
jgi:hypothetical protein